jgi:hypothetical protein
VSWRVSTWLGQQDQFKEMTRNNVMKLHWGFWGFKKNQGHCGSDGVYARG